MQHPIAPHLMSHIPAWLFVSFKGCAHLGTVRYGPVTGRKSANTRAVQQIDVSPDIDWHFNPCRRIKDKLCSDHSDSLNVVI